MLNPVIFEATLAREIFYAPASDGARTTFGVLADGRCAVVKAGCPMRAWPADRPGIAAAIGYFQRLTGPQGPLNTPATPLAVNPHSRARARARPQRPAIDLIAASTANEQSD